jgi:hypothetical protein
MPAYTVSEGLSNEKLFTIYKRFHRRPPSEFYCKHKHITDEAISILGFWAKAHSDPDFIAECEFVIDFAERMNSDKEKEWFWENVTFCASYWMNSFDQFC